MPAKKTTIEYDDTLIKFLDYIAEKHNIKNYSELGFSESSFISLWSDIKTNIPLLNHSRPCGKDTIKPNNFAIFMALARQRAAKTKKHDLARESAIRAGAPFGGIWRGRLIF